MGQVRIADVRIDGGTQSRVAIDAATVSRYAEVLESGGKFKEPIVVYHDGSNFWAADGFHRILAALRVGLKELPADVRPGTRDDAIVYSAGCNEEHGLARTNADKRNAVKLLLSLEKYAKASDQEIAKRSRIGVPVPRGVDGRPIPGRRIPA